MSRGLVLGLCFWLGACSGKSTDGSPGASGSAGSSSGGASGAAGIPTNGASAGSSSGGSEASGGVTSGQPCSPDGAQGMEDCNSCVCSQARWACTHHTCPTPTPCGGFVGRTCSGDEYCAYMIGQSCGAADASSTCQPRPTACDDVFAPVCGCDGNTYGNDCEAASQGTGVMATGMCP